MSINPASQRQPKSYVCVLVLRVTIVYLFCVTSHDCEVIVQHRVCETMMLSKSFVGLNFGGVK